MSRRRALLGGAALALAAPAAGCGLFDEDAKPILVGRRENVLSVGAGLTVDPADTRTISLPAPVPVPSWPQPGRVPSHESVNAAVSGMRPVWSARIGVGANGAGVLAAQPVVDGGRVFTMDGAGVITAFALESGEQIWRTPTKPRKMRSSNIGGGLTVADGTVYVVDGVAESLALAAHDGTVKWRVDVGTPGRSAPTVVNGRMVFGTIDERLIALETGSGRQLWNYTATPSATIVFGQPAPAVVENVVLAGFGSGDIAAVRLETGEAVWSDTLGAAGGRNSIMDFSSIHGLPVITDGTAYVISIGRVLTALDMRSGRRLWERTVSGKDGLVVVGDWLFLLSTDAQLACLDRISGHVRWVSQLPRFRNTKTQKGAIVWSGPVLANGRLICVSDFSKQTMISVDALSGAVGPATKLKSTTGLTPTVAAGKLLLITDDGRLTAYG
ncbi:PQQ-binding-like beta-propeller repeat protein [Lichenicoccus sp.]|uniref:outer membrane protein assembly factor BamB family protein n=1 Tax=Lichenicoccus sp. TaxID=2781899 RepID=UPI003D0F02D2